MAVGKRLPVMALRLGAADRMWKEGSGCVEVEEDQ